MEQKNNILLTKTMTFGAIIGAGLVIVSAILMFANLTESTVGNLVSFLLLVIGLYWGVINYRDKALDGSISYGKALGTGVLIAVFASIILGFFTYIQLKFIDQSLIGKMLELAKQQLIDSHTPEDQIELQMKLAAKFVTPFFMFVSQIFTYTIYGTIFSLVIAFFVKKQSLHSVTEA